MSFVVLLVSFWQRNDLPGDINVMPPVRNEPLQKATDKRAFDVRYRDIDYRVEPQFDYELSGVVVSYRHHEGNSRMHRRANDHLNMLDVCVVWGDNAGNPALQKFDFWNGIFTCRFQTRDGDAWKAFKPAQLSNNHLISDDDYIRDRVRDIKVGDQVFVRGYLASYSNPQGGRRGTSTTRLDTGDGACETIYVEEFRILEAAFSPWRTSMYGSLAVFVGSLVVWFRRPYRPY
ncbi:MAG: hypothetical protein R3288_07075 [Woeseiaceae bacterium]|nr:hypothetical protein [Woeseiaceae bacterium]